MGARGVCEGGRSPALAVTDLAPVAAVSRCAAGGSDMNSRRDADKKSKVIIVAVMRKMITTLNAMLRDNTAWQPRSA
jgi:transposase